MDFSSQISIPTRIFSGVVALFLLEILIVAKCDSNTCDLKRNGE